MNIIKNIYVNSKAKIDLVDSGQWSILERLDSIECHHTATTAD